MARLNRKSELWSHITGALALRDKVTTPLSTATTAAAAVGATSLTVAAITNAAIGDPIRLGRGEEREYLRIHNSTAPTGSTITLEASTPVRYAHAIGDPVVELEATDLGHVEEGGLALEMPGSVEDVNSAVEALLHGQLLGNVGMHASFGLLGYSLENFAFAFGMNEATRVLGSGTPTAPRTLTVDFAAIREQNDIMLQWLGVRKDGLTVRLTAMACELDPSFSFTLARGQKVFLPIKARITGGLLYETW